MSIRIGAAAYVVLAGLLLGGAYFVAYLPYWEMQRLVDDFSTSEDFRAALGDPRYVFFAGESEYCISGYTCDDREITGRVEVYFHGIAPYVWADMILYVYFDENGRIEETFIGGS